MEEAAAVRGAALDAVGDVEPDRLRERIRERLEGGSMAPGVLTLLSARAADLGASDVASVPAPTDRATVASDDDYDAGDQPAAGDGTAGSTGDAVAERGAGVQLIYEGLRLTRTLSHDPPWDRDDAADAGPRDDELTDGGDVTVPDAETSADPTPLTGAGAADMDILVADVMVARGFYLLARTDAAAEAVTVVRSFGSDQTRRRTAGDASLDTNLEVDVFELAAVAGATAAGAEASADLRAHVADLGRTDGALPLAEGTFSDETVATLAAFFEGDGSQSPD